MPSNSDYDDYYGGSDSIHLGDFFTGGGVPAPRVASAPHGIQG